MRKDFQREVLRYIRGYFLFSKQIGINDTKIRKFTFMNDFFLNEYVSLLISIEEEKRKNKVKRYLRRYYS